MVRYMQILALACLLVSATGQTTAYAINTHSESCIGLRCYSEASQESTNCVSGFPFHSESHLTYTIGLPASEMLECSELEPLGGISQFEVAHFAPRSSDSNRNCFHVGVGPSLVSQRVRLQI